MSGACTETNPGGLPFSIRLVGEDGHRLEGARIRSLRKMISAKEGYGPNLILERPVCTGKALPGRYEAFVTDVRLRPEARTFSTHIFFQVVQEQHAILLAVTSPGTRRAAAESEMGGLGVITWRFVVENLPPDLDGNVWANVHRIVPDNFTGFGFERTFTGIIVTAESTFSVGVPVSEKGVPYLLVLVHNGAVKATKSFRGPDQDDPPVSISFR